MAAFSPVRLLARQYADGALERRDYIRERRRIIDAVTRGEVRLPDDSTTDETVSTAPECSLGEMDATIELPRPVEAAPAAPARDRRGWWLIGSLAIALIGTAAWLFDGLASG